MTTQPTYISLEEAYLELKHKQALLEETISEEWMSDKLSQEATSITEAILDNLRQKRAARYKEPYRIFLVDPR